MKELIKTKGLPVALILAFGMVLGALVVGLVLKNEQLLKASLVTMVSLLVGASVVFMAKLSGRS